MKLLLEILRRYKFCKDADWCFQLGNEGTLRPLSKDDGFTKRAEDLETVYGLNGLIYVMNPQELRATKIIIEKKQKES